MLNYNFLCCFVWGTTFFLFRKGGLLHEGVENKALRIYERRAWELLCDQVFCNF
jgi:hypothetical protein